MTHLMASTEISSRKDCITAVQARIPELLAVTRELFESPAQVASEDDPEIEGLASVVFNVVARGEIADIVRRRIEWHRRAAAVLGDAHGAVQLAINVAATAVVIKSVIFTRATGTPTLREAFGSPPTPKIQLPNVVRKSTHVAKAANPSHQTIETEK